MEDFISFAIDAAVAAGGILRDGFLTDVVAREKSPHEYVTQYDLKSEEEIISRITKEFPDHGIYSEEAGDVKHDSEHLWVLDPLDGTHNFINGLPYYGVSVGLLKDGRPLVGVIYLPERDELLHAVAGGGAFLNEDKISVSNRPMERACVLYQSPYPNSKTRPYRLLEELTKHIHSIRILGVAVTSARHIAAGRADAYVMHSLRPYDVGAAALIIEEAGGRVTDFQGEPWGMESKTFVASNGVIHDQLLGIVK